MLGKRLKDARKAAGMTQKELAARLGCSVGAIRQYESDGRRPRYETLMKIGDILCVPYGSLAESAAQRNAAGENTPPSSYEDVIKGAGGINYPVVMGQYIRSAEEAAQALQQARDAVRWFGGDEE